MTYSNCGSERKERRKKFFDFMDEVLFTDLKTFTQKMKEFGEDFRKEFQENMGQDFASNYPLMNVVESKEAYRIEIAAPGLSKESFKISLVEDHLHIEADLESTLSEEEKYRRREFDFGKFKRAYRLPKEADPEKIDAKYTDGILIVQIAKKAPDQNEREIKIS